MTQIDPEDDNLDRFIVWHYHFIEEHGERKLEAVCAFTTRSEADREFGDRSAQLLERQAAGLADPREYVTFSFRRRGYKEDVRNSRLVLKKMKSHWIAQGLTKKQTRGAPDGRSQA